jgi:hypothetical protein
MAEGRKYNPEMLLSMLRLAAELRNKMKDAGFTDNGGAIHSAERILNLLGLAWNYPQLSHINNLRKSADAEFSAKAQELYRNKGKVLIEHVSPLRHFTQNVIDKIGAGESNNQIETYVRENYRLVLLSPEEALQLNKKNRVKMDPARLAGIKMATETNAS